MHLPVEKDKIIGQNCQLKYNYQRCFKSVFIARKKSASRPRIASKFAILTAKAFIQQKYNQAFIRGQSLP
jgi:hypothetical protein